MICSLQTLSPQQILGKGGGDDKGSGKGGKGNRF
jgi:hypothetical protein